MKALACGVYIATILLARALEPDVRMGPHGAVCCAGGRTIHLDPRRAPAGGTAFVSHAHADHLPPPRTPAVSSEETRELARVRGVELARIDAPPGVELVGNGHMLGSSGLLAGGVFYTGDICTRPRAFMRAASVPRCRSLITECTFGLPEFSFPSPAEAARRVNRIISDAYAAGRPVILMGYQFGKAQVLTDMFGHWDPFYVHDSVAGANDAYRRLGVPLRAALSHSDAEMLGLLSRGPWVMVCPRAGAGAEFVRRARSEYGALTVGFSGWGASDRFRFWSRADHVVPLSDHCDFGELVSMVVASGAETVYTVHGFTDEFSAHLRGMGIDSVALEPSTSAAARQRPQDGAARRPAARHAAGPREAPVLRRVGPARHGDSRQVRAGS